MRSGESSEIITGKRTEPEVFGDIQWITLPGPENARGIAISGEAKIRFSIPAGSPFLFYAFHLTEAARFSGSWELRLVSQQSESRVVTGGVVWNSLLLGTASLPEGFSGVELSANGNGVFRLHRMDVRRVGFLEFGARRVFRLLRFLFRSISRDRSEIAKLFDSSNGQFSSKLGHILETGGLPGLPIFSRKMPIPERWLEDSEIKTPPLKFSVVLPVYRVPLPILKEAIDSVLNQKWSHVELCIAHDATGSNEIESFLNTCAKDSRVRLIHLGENRGISIASGEAARLATGDYLLFLDHDDFLASDAIETVARWIERTGADFLYSDEDHYENGLYKDRYYKPEFSPEFLLSQNYITHLMVLKKDLFESAGGFREGYEGSQDHDLALRASEKATKIVRIPEVLYHWRRFPGSTSEDFGSKPYAWENGAKAVREAVKRRRLNAVITRGSLNGTYRIRMKRKDWPAISILIPFRDRVDLLESCLHSFSMDAYPGKLEILLLDNGSIQESTKWFLGKMKKKKGIRVIDVSGPFNFSRIMNRGAREATGEFLILLNNDIQILTKDWIQRLLDYALIPGVGAVGGKLLYPDGRIQHSGIIAGICGVAGHPFKGSPDQVVGHMNRTHVASNFIAVTAALMMVKRELYLSMLGMNEEQFSVSYNDVDFCIRLWKNGFRNVMNPECQAIHFESESRGMENSPEKLARHAIEYENMRKAHGDLIEAGDPYYHPALTEYREDFTPALS